MAAVTRTTANEHEFHIIRGRNEGPNYGKEHISRVKQALKLKGERENIMVHCSHSNLEKNHRNQAVVATNVAGQVASGETAVAGVMIESNLNEGNLKVPPQGESELHPGVSITDACIEWETTVDVLQILRNCCFGITRQFGPKAPAIECAGKELCSFG